MAVLRSAICSFTILIGLVSASVAADIPDSSAILSTAGRPPRHAVVILGDDRFVHGTTIQDVSYVGTKRIVSFGGNTVCLWDAANGRNQDTIRQRGFAARALYNGGDYLLMQWMELKPTYKQMFEVRDLAASQRRSRFQHSQSTASSSMSRDGKLIAVGNIDWSVELLDARTGKSLAKMPPLKSKTNVAGLPKVRLSPDGNMLVIKDLADKANWISRYRFLRIGDGPKIGQEISSIKSANFRNLWFTPDADTVVVVSRGGIATLMNVKTGNQICSVKHGNVTVLGTAVNRKLSLLVTCGADGYVRLWDARNGDPLGEINTEERHPFCAGFSPDETMLITGGGNGRVRFWSLSNGEELMKEKGEQDTGVVCAVAVSPDGGVIAAGGDLGAVTLWDARAGKLIETLKDDESGTKYDPCVGPNFVAFSPDGRTLIAGSNNRHNSVNLWNVATRERAMKIAGHQWPITAVAFAPDGKTFASGSRDKSVRVWDLQGKQLHQFTGSGLQIFTLSFAPDSKRLAAAGFGNQVQVWNLETGELEKTLTAGKEHEYVQCIAFTPDGKSLASSHRNGKVRIWNLDAEDNEPREIDLAKQSQWPTSNAGAKSIAISPDGEILALSRDDGTVTLWDFKSGKSRGKFEGHRAAVTSLAWTRDGKRLISGSADYRIIAWDVPSALKRD